MCNADSEHQWPSLHPGPAHWLVQTPRKSSLNSTTHFLTAYLRPQWALAGLCHYATCYLALIDHFNHPVCLSDTRHARTHMRTHSQRRPCLTSSWVRQTQSINLVIRQLEQIGTRIAGMLIVLARPTRQRPAAVTHSKDPASHEVGLRLFFFPQFGLLGFHWTHSESGGLWMEWSIQCI